MKKLVTLVVLFALTLVGCSDSDYRKAARATAGISSGLKALEQANEVAFAAGELPAPAAKAIAVQIANASLANDQLVANLKSGKQVGGNAAALVGNIADSLGVLEHEGVLGFKNSESRANFENSVAAIKASVVILQSLVGAK